MTGKGKRDEVRVAVVGAGAWGINMVRTFLNVPKARLTWVCDPSAEARDRATVLAPGVRYAMAYRDVLDAYDVDAVVIATPAVTHAKLALKALERRKHVLVEKPLALSVSDAQLVAEAAKKAERVLMVGHLMVYHPVVEHLRGLIDSGELGDILYLYSTRVNLGRVRQDENALWSFAPHDLSMIDYLLSQEPKRVSAVGKGYLNPNIEDVVFVTLEFADRKMAHIHLSWLDPRKERRLTVVGSKKMVVFDDTATDKLRVYDKGYERPPDFTDFAQYLTIRSGGVYIPHIPMSEPLARECAHFIECIRTGTQPRTGIDHALRVIRVLERAQTSLDENYW